MTKDELVVALDVAAREIDQRVTPSMVDGWIDSDLLDKGRRSSNDGLHPSYTFTSRHLERGLAILRLRAAGLADHDAIRLHLFLDGAVFTLPILQETLTKEYGGFVRNVSKGVRSAYADNLLELTPKKLETLGKQLGELDNRFRDAGLDLSEADYVRVFRKARRSQKTVKPAAGTPKAVERFDLASLKSYGLGFVEEFVGGLLKPDAERVETAIREAQPCDWEQARRFFFAVEQLSLMHGLADLLGLDDDKKRALAVAGEAASKSLRQRFALASMLGACLIIAVEKKCGDFDPSKLIRLLSLIQKYPKQFQLRINRTFERSGT